MGRKKTTQSLAELKDYISLRSFVYMLHLERTEYQKIEAFAQNELSDKIRDNALEAVIQKDMIIKKKRGNKTLFYFLKEKIPSFVATYEKELLSLGVQPDVINLLKYRIQPVQKEKSYVRLWNFSRSFSPNIKNISLLADFIKKELISATYKDETGADTSFFDYAISQDKNVRFYLKEELVPAFKEKYQDLLREKSKELDKSNTFMDLDHLRRLLRGTLVISLKELHAFIRQNALDLTFKENGVEKNVFTYQKKALFIHKKGVLSFVKKFEKQLKKMGFKEPLYHIEKKSETDLSLYYTTMNLVGLLGIQKVNLFKDFIASIHSKEFVSGPDGKEKLFLQMCQTWQIKKEFLPHFVQKYKESLRVLGADDKKIEIVVNPTVLEPYHQEMIPFRSFYQQFLLSADAKRTQMILQKFKDTTYLDRQADGSLVEKSIFVSTKITGHLCTVFRNKNAVHALITEHEKELKEMGISINKLALRVFLENRPVLAYSDTYLPLKEFGLLLHINRTAHKIIADKYLDETYPVQQSNGVIKEEPMFLVMKRPSDFGIVVGIKKEAIPYFARRHQQEFNISDIVLHMLENNRSVHSLSSAKSVSFYALWQVLGQGNQKNYRLLLNKIKTSWSKETYPSYDANGQVTLKPLFFLGRSKNQIVGYYIPIEAIDTFITRHLSTLLSHRFKASNISAFMCSSQKRHYPLQQLLKENFIRTR